MKGILRRSAFVLALAILPLGPVPAESTAGPAIAASATGPVVVATFDTGTNPFHPCFRRPGIVPHESFPGFPADAPQVRLTFDDDYEQALADSQSALGSIQPSTLVHVADTNIAFYGSEGAATELVDDYPHGAQASSQIACEQFGLAPEVLLVVLNAYDNPFAFPDLLGWTAAQPWIDVIHLNMQDMPYPLGREPGIWTAMKNGKMVVVAAGNGVAGLGPNYPMEISRYNRYAGTLIAGANDNGGYTYYSNLDPHVVMDGCGTVAAAPRGYGQAGFSGTSSASPRITGYVAHLLALARARYGHTGGEMVTIPDGAPRPSTGPLADGVLTAADLHEVVRKTANPDPHPSKYDGSSPIGCGVPVPVGHPAAYPKMGYGEVSEHTIDEAMAVIAGEMLMPERPVEDTFYAVSEGFRDARTA